MTPVVQALAGMLATLMCSGAWATVAPPPPPALVDVAFEQQLGARVPLAAGFTDESGHSAGLAQFLDGKPAVLVLGYDACPNLCSTVRAALVQTLATMKPGVPYTVLAVSIDPAETPAALVRARRTTPDLATNDHAGSNWRFLTGESGAITALAQSVGFHYVYDAALGQYAHAAGIVVLTPNGAVARYFLGVDYPPAELRRSLDDAAGERTGTRVPPLLLRCFHYDPATGTYSLTVEAAARVLGTVTVLALGSLIALLWRRERRGQRKARAVDR